LSPNVLHAVSLEDRREVLGIPKEVTQAGSSVRAMQRLEEAASVPGPSYPRVAKLLQERGDRASAVPHEATARYGGTPLGFAQAQGLCGQPAG
jgi:hypothetical protein